MVVGEYFEYISAVLKGISERLKTCDQTNQLPGARLSYLNFSNHIPRYDFGRVVGTLSDGL